MSHSKERSEKICLNCQAELHGYYCHVCGQENREPKDTVWGLVSHFFYDITHFDGKFFGTLKHLVRKPGFLSKEYMIGRRASYLNPIRMYVFTSALFFIIFFTIFNPRDIDWSGGTERVNQQFQNSAIDVKQAALAKAKTREDSARMEEIFGAAEKLKPDSALPVKSKKSKSGKRSINWSGTDKYRSVAEYDSLEKTLPENKRDGWFESSINRRLIYLRAKYKGDDNQFGKDLVDKLVHSIPSILFVSLPLYAFFLKLLYIRRKKFYYVDHGIFLIHLYIFTFLLLLVYFGFNKLQDMYDIGLLTLLKIVLLAYGVYYAFRSMKNFYGQGSFKTFLKFMMLNLLATISVIVLFTLFLGITILRL